MTHRAQLQTALWLIVSACLLTTLIPGGPVENRDFSHIHPAILGLFNVFLTTLDLGSFVVAFFAFRGHRWALGTAYYAAIAYFAVYAVDLAQIFPRSPTPMSFALAFIEVLGMTVAVPLMFSARRALAQAPANVAVPVSKTRRLAVTTALVLAGLGIVWFATDAALRGGSDQAAISASVSGR